MPTHPALPRSSFVTVMAWLSLAVGLLGVVAHALQALMLWAMPGVTDLGAWLPPGAARPPLLDVMGRYLWHLTWLGLGLSALLAWISWGLLQRREWARLAFIAGLVLVALANFACIPLLDALARSMVPGGPGGADGAELAQLHEAMAPMLLAVRWAGWLGALAIAAVHGWIAWQLCRPAIRAEFARR